MSISISDRKLFMAYTKKIFSIFPHCIIQSELCRNPFYKQMIFILNFFLFSGYWPSYNVPFFEEIYNRSGYNDVYTLKSNQYQMAARAKIFRRDANKVNDLKSMKSLLRSNSECQLESKENKNVFFFFFVI